MDWLRKKLHHDEQPRTSRVSALTPPPAWAPATENSHLHGLYSNASEAEAEAAVDFCNRNPTEQPRLLPSDVVELIETIGIRAWGIEYPRTPRFVGHVSPNPSESKGGSGVVKVTTDGEKCRDACLLSDLPLSAGLYNAGGKSGVYYEITIDRMDGTIAIGMACRPYPNFRLPGWNRLSVGLHLDDLRKFFEDPEGGMDYAMPGRVGPGDTVGCGFEFGSTAVFFTYNGARLENAFSGVYVPREAYDIYAALGVYGGPNEFEANFGAEPFRWKEGNEWAWRPEGAVGRLSGPSGRVIDDELPTYAQARNGG